MFELTTNLETIEATLSLEFTPEQLSSTYQEDDLLDIVIFNQSSQQWQKAHPQEVYSLREKASFAERLALANISNYNKELIKAGHSQAQRMQILRRFAKNFIKTTTKLSKNLDFDL